MLLALKMNISRHILLRLRLAEIGVVLATIFVVASIPMKIFFADQFKAVDEKVSELLGITSSTLEIVSAVTAIIFIFWFASKAKTKGEAPKTSRSFGLVVITLMSIAGVSFAGLGVYLIANVLSGPPRSAAGVITLIGIAVFILFLSAVCVWMIKRARLRMKS